MNDMRKFINLLTEAELPPTAAPAPLATPPAKQYWIMADEDGGAYIACENEQAATYVAYAVFAIEEAGLDYDLIPRAAFLSDEFYNTDLGFDDDYIENNEIVVKPPYGGHMQMSIYPVPNTDAFKKYCRQHNVRIITEKGALKLSDRMDRKAERAEKNRW
ncbi:hypothetical protein UFOVP29_12 [uncultured Caudovirales phage]|uniref:Uncharacterized protein n=1 Tax=uncultured Caudovirales phage TaxID=2100421 RepID=A0A6J5KMH2_9CAUD|nr:hypothetical protein UFOVP29_12 [uncultured Caudovirales phage]